MTDVKIYTITSDDLSPPITGEGFCTDMVRHRDYAALLAERDQLAAENAALKAISDDRRMFIMNGVQLGYIKVPTIETDPALETIRIAVSPQEPTPSTDAWQREQMAKGVEMFSEQQRSYIGKPSKNDAASSYCSREALKFADQLRQGELS